MKKLPLGVLLVLLCNTNAFALSPSIGGCTQTVTEFSNPNVAAITDLGVINSTVTVSGVGTYLADIDVFVDLDHTANDDIDMTLTSPTGHIVTLTTDNGGNNDNVFSGTLFDDQAALFSRFTGTKLHADTYVFSDAVIAPYLSPEEPLGAFFGINPNGTWTLTISDDLAAETGTLNKWFVRVTTCSGTPAQKSYSSSNSSALAVNDNGTVSSNLSIANAAGTICKVSVNTNLSHTFPGDLDVSLISPYGTEVFLTQDYGGSSDNVFAGTTWTDDSDSLSSLPYASADKLITDTTFTSNVLKSNLTPQEGLAVFNGQNPNGTWILSIADDFPGDTGTLNSWSLNITTCLPDSDGDGVSDSEDLCNGSDTDSNANGTVDCREADVRPVHVSSKKTGGRLECKFKVKNFAPVPVAASKAQVLYGAFSDSVGKLQQTVDVPALAAGETSSTFTVKKAAKGRKYCIYNVDSANVLTETNETNNRIIKKAK